MWDTSERLLKLLALLQRQETWSSSSLCRELAVTPRTISRDILRLRNLGYPVTTMKVIGGGYTLQRGAVLPPIMLTREEATAVLLALRFTPAPAPSDVHSTTALEKVRQALPRSLKGALQALATHSTSIDLGQPIPDSAPEIDPALLLLLSRSCRDRRQVTCAYRHYNGYRRTRRLEPTGLVHTMNRWYLVAYCTQDDKWAILRADRITDAELSAHPSGARQPPSEDLGEYVGRAVARGWQQVTSTVRVHAPKVDVSRWVSPAWGTVTEETPLTCIVQAGADNYDSIARWLLLITAEITVITPPELTEAFQHIAEQAQRTTTPHPENSTP